jgi:hypothetical protein
MGMVGVAALAICGEGSPPVAASFCQLSITIDDKNVTAYLDEHRTLHEHLELPAYFLAEWIADNWWPLLWEPRKSEDAPDAQDFIARHCILAAQHGFALPRIHFNPTGRSILISARSRIAPLAEVRFRNSATASPPREEVERELRRFVEATVERLEQAQISGTGLHESWALVKEITEEEQLFCRLAGALGLTPDEVSDSIAALLDSLLPTMGERLLMDLCLVATPDNFEAMTQTADAVRGALSEAAPAHIEPLLSIPVPTDNFSVEAWHRGRRAAAILRSKFGVSDTDAHGAKLIFDRLGIDPNSGARVPANETHLSGVVARDGAEARLGLLQPISVQRRFAAARGVFAAWTAEPTESRFLTSAVTRGQQANRAFAAELTAPIAFLRKNARRSKLQQNQVFDLAAELEIGGDVVSKQALNNGLQVVPI